MITLLQCGHGTQAVENRMCRCCDIPIHRCFNAATALKPWRTRQSAADDRAAGDLLQCGHGTQAVENVDYDGSAQ